MDHAQGAQRLDQRELALDQARDTVDILELLKTKTEGNLDEEEQQLMDAIVGELKMSFVEVQQAIARSRAGVGKPPGMPGMPRLVRCSCPPVCGSDPSTTPNPANHVPIALTTKPTSANKTPAATTPPSATAIPPLAFAAAIGARNAKDDPR